MSQAQASVTAARPTFKLKLRDRLEQGKHRLYAYRPRFRNWHFWMVQGLVIFIAGWHNIVESPGLLRHLGVPFIIPTSLFLVPVIYAALTFGLAGAITTALWATLLTIPNWVFWHRGLERFECMSYLLIVNVVAFLVGQQVDRQKKAWQQAEATAIELKASRMKYRSLFESSPIAILVLDPAGVILEANPTAGILFSRGKATLEGMHIADLVGAAGAQKLLGSFQTGQRQSDSLAIKLKDGPELYLEPMLTEISDSQGNPIIQVLFRDATEEHGRQVGLRAYAAYVIRAQEEERQRIARELHDETIQSLVLLCRRLDGVPGSNESLPASVIDTLREARGTAEEAVNQLRDFTKSLRPPILDDLGMVTSIRRLLTDFTERAKIKGQLKVAGEERRLPSDVELGMFRIAQEALRNVERHAEATDVMATITFVKHEARLEVIDNGVGFSLASVSGDVTTKGHIGLLSMQERAELLGGKLEIQTSPGKGTKLTVSIPVTDNIPKITTHHVNL